MLILTRKIGESIVIGEGIIVTVLNVKGRQAKIGVAADKEIPVHREEIFQKIISQQSDLEHLIVRSSKKELPSIEK